MTSDNVIFYQERLSSIPAGTSLSNESRMANKRRVVILDALSYLPSREAVAMRGEISKGYRPEARGYVIYSHCGLPEGNTRGE